MKGYRTLAFNAAVALIGLAETIDWTQLVGAGGAGWALTAIAIANMALRGLTTGPVGRSS